MLENFQLAAIVKQGTQLQLFSIPLQQALQVSLAEGWEAQFQAFLDGIHEVAFNAGYKPDDHERFSLAEFAPPPWLASETSSSVPDLPSIGKDPAILDSTRGIAAFGRRSGGEVVLFQSFSRSQIVRPQKYLFLEGSLYVAQKGSGFALADRLSAVYLRPEGKLLFHNFRTVNLFLPLADLYEEASEQQIRTVLSHEVLAPEDPDALATDSNQWLRKRFAMLGDSGILNQYTADQIKARSGGYDVDIQVSEGRIVFPSERRAARKLLQFLNEELFRGAITETLYETNSKRASE